jgi:hypothetical protein
MAATVNPATAQNESDLVGYVNAVNAIQEARSQSPAPTRDEWRALFQIRTMYANRIADRAVLNAADHIVVVNGTVAAVA